MIERDVQQNKLDFDNDYKMNETLNWNEEIRDLKATNDEKFLC